MKFRRKNLVPRRAVLGAALTVLICMAAAAWPASAQLSRVGISQLATAAQIGTPAIKGNDTAYDPVNRVYLVVHAYFPIVGWFVNANGAPVTAMFDIARGGGGFHYPRARYSPHVNGGRGGFLVTYMEEGANNANLVHARVIAYPGVLVGSDNIISDAGSPAWIESGAAVAYSPVSQRFLVAWRGSAVSAHLSARLVDTNGAGVLSVLPLSGSGFGRDPSVAWNSATNEFGVSFGAENSAGSAGFLCFSVVSPATGAFTRQSFGSILGFTYITDLDYNPDTGRYVMTWHQKPGGVSEVRSSEIDTAGNPLTSELITRTWPGYDALAVAFNPVSRTFLLASLGSVSTLDELEAVELNSRGVRTTAITPIVPPSVDPGVLVRYPRAASSTDAAQWNVSFNDGFSTLKSVVVATTSTNGGPATAPAGGGTTGGTPSACTTPQPGANWICVNGGWLPPTTSGGGSTTGGSTGGCTTPQPGAGWTCSNGNWLPPTTSGGGSTTGGTSTGSCTTPQPGANWTCSNGNWLPPGAGPAPTGSTGSCTTPQPGANWTCSNGNWLPPGAGGAPTGGGSTGSCTTPQPGTNWSCVNGNWLPPGAGGAPIGGGSTGSCTTPQPGADWTCSNGNWLPPGMGGSPGVGSTASCTTPQPGANWTCSNGNWLPPGTGGGSSTSSCTTPQPGANWTCSNGNWLPPGSGGSTSSCTTVQPGPSWVCVNGDWHPSAP